MARPLFICFWAVSIISLASSVNNYEKPIDTQRSSLVIHVRKAGLLSAAGHEHWIDAPLSDGSVDDVSAMRSVRFSVNAAKLTVMADKNVSAKDLAEVQSNMQNKVLESSKYPNIAFYSTRVEPVGDDFWRVEGNLTLHGKTRRVMVDVKRLKDAYTGRARISQSDFHIQPVQIAGGLVKVKNELEIQFNVYVMSSPEISAPQ